MTTTPATPMTQYPLWKCDRLYLREGLPSQHHSAMVYGNAHYYPTPESSDYVLVTAVPGEDIRVTVEKAMFAAGVWPVGARPAGCLSVLDGRVVTWGAVEVPIDRVTGIKSLGDGTLVTLDNYIECAVPAPIAEVARTIWSAP